MSEIKKIKLEKINKLIGTKIDYINLSNKRISFKIEPSLKDGCFGYILKSKCIEGDGDIKTNGIYALKFTFKEKEIKNYDEIDYKREKKILSNLYELSKKGKGCKYIMKLYDSFEKTINGDDYKILVMEFCEGINLDDVITQCNLEKKYLDEILIIKILYQLLETLNFLHKKCHIIHRDIKPSNIILGNDNNIKLLDFGLCAYLEKDDITEDDKYLVSRKSLKGCVEFVAPEILYNSSNNKIYEGKFAADFDYDYKVDIFSLGFTIYNIMEPIGRTRNLPEKTNKKKDECYERVKSQKNKNSNYSKWLVDFIESFYNKDMEKRPTSSEALEKLNAYISKNKININRIIHVTYLNNVKSNFQTTVLEFLKPSDARKIKLITSMKSVLQVLYRLDNMKKIKKDLRDYKEPINYKKTLLKSFFDILDVMEKYEQKLLQKGVYEEEISKFINQTFIKNKTSISGIIPSNLFYMLLETFTEEICQNFNFLCNDAFDKLYKNNKYDFGNLKVKKQDKLNSFIDKYKTYRKGPFVNNFYFVNLKLQECEECKEISQCPIMYQNVPLDIQKNEENIQELIDKFMFSSFSNNICQKCKKTVRLNEKNIFLNTPLYLVLELEDIGNVLFEDSINIMTFDEKEVYYEFVSCICKTKDDNNVSKYIAIVINKDTHVFETYSDDNIKIDEDLNLNLNCPSLAFYKKIL